jgi:hypothetical protein
MYPDASQKVLVIATYGAVAAVLFCTPVKAAAAAFGRYLSTILVGLSTGGDSGRPAGLRAENGKKKTGCRTGQAVVPMIDSHPPSR